jgi:hypothetical protein
MSIGIPSSRTAGCGQHMDPYVALLLLYMFNPICTSLRSLQQASALQKVQKKLGVPRASLGSLSEAATVFDGTRKAPNAFDSPVPCFPGLRLCAKSMISDGPASPEEIPPRGEAGVFRLAATDMWARGLDTRKRASPPHRIAGHRAQDGARRRSLAPLVPPSHDAHSPTISPSVSIRAGRSCLRMTHRMSKSITSYP